MKNIKDVIIKNLKLPNQAEPLWIVVDDFKKLQSEIEKNEYILALKSIIISGTEIEKYACLTIIGYLDKSIEIKEIVREFTNTIDSNKDLLILSAIIWHLSKYDDTWAIEFLKKVLKDFKNKDEIKYSTYKSTLSSIMSAKYWKEAIEDFKYMLKREDDNYFTWFFAYFRWRQNEKEEKELLKLLKEEDEIIRKYKLFKNEIDERYIQNYAHYK